jgi:hypothetical protein
VTIQIEDNLLWLPEDESSILACIQNAFQIVSVMGQAAHPDLSDE